MHPIYTEDHLVEQPAIELMQHELGWDVVNCYDEWNGGVSSQPLRGARTGDPIRSWPRNPLQSNFRMTGMPIAEIAEIPQKLRGVIHCGALFWRISQKSHNNYETEGTDAENNFNAKHTTPENAEAAPKDGPVTPSTTWWMG
jgi:hypothetical protein